MILIEFHLFDDPTYTSHSENLDEMESGRIFKYTRIVCIFNVIHFHVDDDFNEHRNELLKRFISQ